MSDNDSSTTVCGVCKLSILTHATLQLLTSTLCGHSLCDACAGRGFATSATVKCPQCGVALRRRHLIKSTVTRSAAKSAAASGIGNGTNEAATAGPASTAKKLGPSARVPSAGEDGGGFGTGAAGEQYSASLAQEMKIRKKIMDEFNKRRQDCSSDREYNDYLERREQLVYNLLHGIDVEEVHEAIRVNRIENAKLIARNQAIRDAEMTELQARIEQEKREWLERRRQALRADQLAAEQERREAGLQVDGLAAGQSVEEVEADSAKRRELMQLEQTNAAQRPAVAAATAQRGAPVAQKPPAERQKPVYVASSLVGRANGTMGPPTGGGPPGQPTPLASSAAAQALGRNRPAADSPDAKKAGGWSDSWPSQRALAELSREPSVKIDQVLDDPDLVEQARKLFKNLF